VKALQKPFRTSSSSPPSIQWVKTSRSLRRENPGGREPRVSPACGPTASVPHRRGGRLPRFALRRPPRTATAISTRRRRRGTPASKEPPWCGSLAGRSSAKRRRPQTARMNCEANRKDIRSVEVKAARAKKEMVEANLAPSSSPSPRSTRTAASSHRPGSPGGQHRPHEGRGQRPSSTAALQVLNLSPRGWIRQAITRAIACDQAPHHPIPVAHRSRPSTKLDRHLAQLCAEWAASPPEEIAIRWKCRWTRCARFLKIAQEPISLETPIGEEEDSHLGDFIETSRSAHTGEA